MSKNIKHIQHIKSSVVENGSPKLPAPSAITEGEIAVNYAEGYETISIKTSSGNIVTFSSDNYYSSKKLGSAFTDENSAVTVTDVIDENEEITSAALNDLDERKLDASAYTPTDLSNYYTKDETSGATEIAEAFSAKADTTWVEEKFGSGFTGENSGVTVTQSLNERDEVIAYAINEINGKIDNSTDNIMNIINDDGEAIASAFNYLNGKVGDIDASISGKADVSWVENKERAVAAALVDLDERKLDASGVTDLTQAVNTISGDVDTLVDQNEVIAAALVDLDDRKMDTLVSGESIKTINQESLLGSGDIAIEGGFKKFTNPTASTKVGLVNSLVTTYGTDIGNLAVIEGNMCVANGYASHVEGLRTEAYGGYSHSEGWSTTTSGNASHAEGYATTTNGEYSHAEGHNSVANGESSHAEGWSSIASGIAAHAEGSGTTASGNYSHAEGRNTLASGVYSHAEGWNTSATTANAHAEGNKTIANGQASHAEGWETKASGNYSHAEGWNTSATTNYTHAEGSGTTASGLAAHAEGNGTTASGQYSHAEGNETKANGQYSHAEGYQTSATTNYTHSEGYQTKASGEAAHAEGEETLASGVGAHAEGVLATASGYASHAEGVRTKASGYTSHAEGSYTTASGDYSHADGYQTKATNKVEHASGQYNISSTANTTFGNNGNTLFSVGNGYNTANTHNAFEIRQNGDVYIANTDETTHSNYYQKDMYRLQDAVKAFGTVNANATAITATNAADAFTITGGTFLGVTADTTNKKITLNVRTGATTTTVARGSHNHASSAVTAMTSYNTSGTDALPIATSDTLNTAVRKLENGLNEVSSKLNNLSIVKMTQAEYNALSTKDPNTIYIVV